MKLRPLLNLFTGLTVLFGLVGITETAWAKHQRNFHELVDLNPTLYRQLCNRIRSNPENCDTTYRLGVPIYLVTGNLGEMAYVTILNRQVYVWDWVSGDWIPREDSPTGTYHFVLLLREFQEQGQ